MAKAIDAPAAASSLAAVAIAALGGPLSAAAAGLGEAVKYAEKLVGANEALLADRVRVLGPDHPDTLTTRNNLASMRGRAGDATGAATAYSPTGSGCSAPTTRDHDHYPVSCEPA